MLKRKILITSPSFPPRVDGLSNAVYSLALSLKKYGYEIKVATFGHQRSTSFEKKNSLFVERFNISNLNDFFRSCVGDMSHYLSFLENEDFDFILLNAWQNWATDLYFHIKKTNQTKVILYSHCISTNEFLTKTPFKSMIRYLFWRHYWWKVPSKMKLLDGIIFLDDCIDSSRFDDLKVANKINLKRYFIPNSYSIEAHRKSKIKSKTFLNRDQLICVGSYTWQKGFDFVLKSYARSIAKNKIKIKFFGFNENSYLNDLTLLSKKLGINKKFIEFKVGVEKRKLLDEYEKAKIFLFASHTECQPLSIIEACSTGTPFIAKNSGSISNIPGGIVINNVSEMSKKINYLLEDINFWNYLSLSGKTSGKLKYNIDINTKKIIKVLGEV